MRKIKVTMQFGNHPLEKLWNLITDIEKYPQRVKYVKKVKVHGTGLGSKWDDITTILWIPMRMRHTVNAFNKNKEYGFIIPLRFNGYMEQKYTLFRNDEKSIVEGVVKFDLGNKILDKVLGSVLKKNLKTMLESSFQKQGGEIIN